MKPWCLLCLLFIGCSRSDDVQRLQARISNLESNIATLQQPIIRAADRYSLVFPPERKMIMELHPIRCYRLDRRSGRVSALAIGSSHWSEIAESPPVVLDLQPVQSNTNAFSFEEARGTNGDIFDHVATNRSKRLD